MEPKRGFLLQAPMGSGKTYYIKHHVPKEYQFLILDGDELLKKHNIKNKNDYWYDVNKEKERQDIIHVFNQYLNLGYWIFYSGHPEYIKTDVIVLPKFKKRWKQLQNRNDYKPTHEKIMREQMAYKKSSHACLYFINGDIPAFDILYSIYLNLQK